MTYEQFRIRRQQDLRDALDLLWAMRDTMPRQSYTSMRYELYAELDSLNDDNVVRFDHLVLMRDSPAYCKKE